MRATIAITIVVHQLALGAGLALAQPQKKIRIDLDSAIRIGATNTFALKAIQNRKEAVRQMITERWRSYLPSAGVGYNRTNDINSSARDSIRHEVRLTIEQVLYDGGKRGLDLDLAKIDGILAQDDFRETYNRLRFDIQKAYLQVLAARGKVELNEKSLSRAQMELKMARTEERTGFATRVQVLTVAARVREIELALERSRNQYRQSIFSLKQLLLLDYDSEVDVAGDIFRDFFLHPPSLNTKKLIEIARANKPEVRKSLTEVHRLKMEKEIAENYWIPKVSLRGYVSQSSDRFPLRDRGWGVSLNVSFPIGSTSTSTSTGLDTRANGSSQSGTTSTDAKLMDDLSYERKILEAKTALGQAIARNHELTNSVAIDVEKAASDLTEAWESIRIGNGRVYFQYEGLRLMHTRYNVGEVKRADIVFQETELVRAQGDLTDAISQYITGVYQLEFAAGQDSGVLALFRFLPGKGNTLLSMLIMDDFTGMKRKVEKDDKSPSWIIDKEKQTDTKKETRGTKAKGEEKDKFLIDDVDPNR